MNVLITGGCGFLGSNLAAFYLAQGADVVIVDALFRHGSATNLLWIEQLERTGSLRFYQLDIADSAGVDAVFRRHAPFDFICHVGGQVAMTSSLVDPARDLQTNVVGTFNILESARKYSPNSLIAYSSTNKVYGDLEWLRYSETATRYLLPDFPAGLDESVPLDFSTPYGCSKGSADQYVRDWARVYGLKTVVFRHSSIYGGRQYASSDQGWIGWFCLKAIEQKHAYQNASSSPQAFTISGTGKQVRDVLHADDLVLLYDAAFRKREAMRGEIFNIGGGAANSLSLLELFDLLRDLLDMPPLLFEAQLRRTSDQDCFIADISKADKILGWEPKVDPRSGIRRMLEWTAARSQ